jgi:hypothetical protein
MLKKSFYLVLKDIRNYVRQYICIISGYKYTSYRIEKSTTKAIAFVEKIGYMLQQRQIVKGLGKQIDIEDPAYRKYAGTSFQSIVWMLIFDIVTIKRNAAVLQRYVNNHCIMLITKLLRSYIKNYEHY